MNVKFKNYIIYSNLSNTLLIITWWKFKENNYIMVFIFLFYYVFTSVAIIVRQWITSERTSMNIVWLDIMYVQTKYM